MNENLFKEAIFLNIPALSVRKVHQINMREKIKNKPKASDVFDMGEVSLVLEECREKSGEKSDICDKSNHCEENMSISGAEESFDEFDCMESHKPLAERINRNKI